MSDYKPTQEEIDAHIAANTTTKEVLEEDALDEQDVSILDPDKDGNPVLVGTTTQWTLDDFGNKVMQVLPIYRYKTLTRKTLKTDCSLDAETGKFLLTTKPSTEDAIAAIVAAKG